MALLRKILGDINCLSRSTVANLSNNRTSLYKNVLLPIRLKSSCTYDFVDPKENELLSKDVIKTVNEQATQKNGRLFAVVHVAGKQFKITEGDVIIIEGYWPPNAGDRISLDKVLMLGSTDFTMFGRPLVQPGLVNIIATVIEKGLSHTKTHFRKKRRKQYMRINFYRLQQTMLRINSIELKGKVNEPQEVLGLENKVF